MSLISTILLVFLSACWPTHFQYWDGEEDYVSVVTPAVSSYSWEVVDQGHMMAVLYAWNEKSNGFHRVRVADDGGLDVKGGQTVYIRWMYDDVKKTIRARDLEKRVKELTEMVYKLSHAGQLSTGASLIMLQELKSLTARVETMEKVYK